MASLAIGMALATDRVTADVVEANEFTELSELYQVRGVRMTIVNDAAGVVGAVPPAQFLEQLREVFDQQARGGEDALPG